MLVSLGCSGGLIWVGVFETNFGDSSGELSFLYRRQEEGDKCFLAESDVFPVFPFRCSNYAGWTLGEVVG